MGVAADSRAFIPAVGFCRGAGLTAVRGESLVSALGKACASPRLPCGSIDWDALLAKNDEAPRSFVDEYEEGLDAIVTFEAQVREVCLPRIDLFLEKRFKKCKYPSKPSGFSILFPRKEHIYTHNAQ